MPVISFVSPKGGAGKSTAALLLATELAQKGARVSVIDADPLGWISDWGSKPDKPRNLEILPKPTEETVIDQIEAAQQRSQFVIVDLEGTANMLVAFAISQSDLVVIPTQPSHMDGRGAAQAIKLIKQQEKAMRRSIPYAVLFTRAKAAIRTRSQGNIEAQLKNAEIPVFQTQLLEREAYRSIFSFGGTLKQLPANTYKLDDAIKNARAFVGEVISLVTAHRNAEKRGSRADEAQEEMA
ncbi:ParA family protein [uncultured Paraglaciecola sp.]|uniref:ParA family protein n=1 Tax=uncultured Paraglaciecola sp. TaxID=1765024 RepID=UPI00262E7F75|nr:ParA family protein [uncultured Paraglaciecola sp.]